MSAAGRLLLAELLAEQQELTAVERFARKHELRVVPPGEKYRDLVPLTMPRPGQQLAFEVDLDACTGCKACVTACHNLNGLDDGEVWRTVGLLHGGTPEAPVQQTVTTACHHCLDPACMTGCPVKAYEKDPITGIVKHLDDQCIGCQYCVLMCAYDAPKYSPSRGIVRKCDMCTDRLGNGEAPACVQACPNEAIRITVVEQARVVEEAEADAFLPGAPALGGTLPTTVYQTARPRPKNLLPADFYAVTPEATHPPLVIMLVLTQLAVGALVTSALVRWFAGAGATGSFGASSGLLAAIFGGAAMFGSLFHLGRPQHAYRALLGLRTSWLSREILAFTLFAAVAGLSAASYTRWLPKPPGVSLVRWRTGLDLAGAATGLVAVFASVMVYAATRRDHWRAAATAFRFFMTTVVLGAATTLVAALIASPGGPGDGGDGAPFRILGQILCGASALQLAWEAALLGHRRDRQHSARKRSALLLLGELGGVTSWRFACGVLGGIVLPGLGLGWGPPASRAALGVLLVAMFLCTLAGAFLERTLFFAAASARRMPGGPT